MPSCLGCGCDRVIRLRGVSYTYPEGELPALRDVGLDVAEGEICAIVGANGAGKSTLAQVLAGFCPHFEGGELDGEVHVAGLDIASSRMEDIVPRVGLVLQNPFNQISGARFTVREEVAFGLENLGVPEREMGARVDEMLETLRIDHLASRSPYELSGGQQQLVALAAILVMRPRVVVLDEPTSQLDPAGTDLVFTALRALRDTDLTTVLIEHKLEQLEQYADSVVVLADGVVRAKGRPREVLAHDELEAWGVGGTRFSRAARELRTRGWWRPDVEIPVSLGDAVDAVRRLTGAAAVRPAAVEVGEPAAGEVRLDWPVTDDGGSADLEVTGLRFRYPSGVTALDGVDLTVAPGERVAVIGENGAGKTTLVKHLNGIFRPSDGQVLVGGWDTREHSVAQLAQRVAYLFQNPAEQLFARTVRREVEFGPRNLGYAQERVAELTDAALRALSLTRFADDHPYQLTQTEQKRVALACVLAMNTPVVILDEPTTGQDYRTMQTLRAVVGMLAKAGRTVIAVTHDMDFAAENFDRIVTMARGRVLADTPVADAFLDDAVLREAAVHPPQLTRLGRELGWVRPVLTVSDLVERVGAVADI
ncbi:MAG: ATP-binding cassette domain-containing protein [Streptosporangiales bacterium]|nr:ATP-binding cassette domain-containing protein [Streptosporangiales bacterium]